MLLRFPPRSRRCARASHGVALVIVLAFVVLLSGLVLAFFSRALSERTISNSSATQTRVELFAQGASATIIGDLKQEIAAGSTSLSPTPAPVTGFATIYRPKPPTSGTVAGTAMPAYQGFAPTFASTSDPLGKLENDGLNNLLKVSVNKAPFYAGSNYTIKSPDDVPNRASSITTTTADLNGRSVSLARWNKPLLLTPVPSTDPTYPAPASVSPSNKFPTPCWILVARSGANPGSSSLAATFGAGGINSPDPSNSNYVTGRYAYTIYNEGGLLDANAAGYPNIVTNHPVPSSNPTITDQTLYKNSAAYADLTQLQDLSASPQSVLTQQLVDQLVGWRNNASASASGSLGAYTFADADKTTNGFISWATFNRGNFLQANSSLKNSALGTDRLFTSRQSLIQFVRYGLGGNETQQHVLQCLGTFSRALNQPSIWPDPLRPKVKLKGTQPTGYDPNSVGGNTAYSSDGSYSDVLNPAFRSVRVARSFTRADGSLALVGEPLVKKRFALNRVAWITYEGPSAVAQDRDALVAEYVKRGMAEADATALLSEGTADNIKNYFGLTWYHGPGAAGVGGYWVYDHGISAGGATLVGSLLDPSSGAQPPDVVSASPGREPDFFELLKASINVGAIGKDWTGISSMINGKYYQGTQDTALGPQILAIGANIIDAASPTQYPTIIRYNFAGGDVRTVYGKTDLPYYYGDMTYAMVLKAPTTLPNSTGQPTATTTPISNLVATAGYYPTEAGTAALLFAPVIWNPYDVNGPQVSAGFAPTQLRIVLSDPIQSFNALASGPPYVWPPQPPWIMNGTNSWGYRVESVFDTPNAPWQPPPGPPYSGYSQTTQPDGTVNTHWPTYTWAATPRATWPSEESTALYFNNPNPGDSSTYPASRALYREPTILMRSTSSGASGSIPPSKVPDLYMGLHISPQHHLTTTNPAWTDGIPEVSGEKYIGELLGTFPMRFTDKAYQASDPTVPRDPNPNYIYTINQITTLTPAAGGTWRMEYLPAGAGDLPGNWIPYQDKYVGGSAGDQICIPGKPQDGSGTGPYLLTPNYIDPTYPTNPTVGMTGKTSLFYGNAALQTGKAASGGVAEEMGWDPRTDRWGTPGDISFPTAKFLNALYTSSPSGSLIAQTASPANLPPPTLFMETIRPYSAIGAGTHSATIPGWNRGSAGPHPGMMSQNITGGNGANFYYSGADTVVRRAMGGNNAIYPGAVPSSTYGLPLATAITNFNPGSNGAANVSNRPMLLHRPYRSVEELSYVFADTPWLNIDFSNPESGFTGLLDLFCVNEDTRADALVAGKVDLNTRQPSVLAALMMNSYREAASPGAASVTPMAAAEASKMAARLIGRTTSSFAQKGPLANVGDLVGRYVPGFVSDPYTNYQAFDGFSRDTIVSTATPIAPTASTDIIQRFREAPIRSLANLGQAGTWNLLIDVVAQTGRYPTSATSLQQFAVEGEKRYWVHVAIDRQTGQVIDQQIEQVNE